MPRVRQAARAVYACLRGFPSYRNYIYPVGGRFSGDMVGYAPANLSRITVGSQIRMAELTRALGISTFHGPFPERLVASLAKGGRRANYMLFFNYLGTRERRLLKALRRRGQKRILDIHDIPHKQQLYFGEKVREDYRAAFQAFARECDILLLNTRSMAEMFREEADGSAKMLVLPNAADPVRFPPTRLPERKVFSYVGGYAPTRGVERLVAAFSILKQRQNNVWLWLVVPNTELMPSWISRIEGVTVFPNVSYDSGAADVFRASYACVIPHDRNPYMDAVIPVKLFEAMASSRPVVVTDCYEMRKMVREEECGVASAADESALADAMDKLANDRESAEQMGKRGRLAVEARHSWNSRAVLLRNALEHDG
jgi:glycosyltransferase involved in cell wall biosynthesis